MTATLLAPHEVRRIAVLGSGTIGASWAALFLANGFSVSLQDAAPDAEAKARRFVERAWPALEQLGLAPGADPAAVSFATDPAEAVADCDFVQENVPERLPVKLALYRAIEPALSPHALVATSTSGLLLSALQQGFKAPWRLVLAHPFNPPHLLPLVELFANEKTHPEALAWAERFYRGIGKTTIRLNKEVPGHIANRMQAAVIREAVHLVAEGVASVADVDLAISAGPGIRWAIMGPHMNAHLATGGAGLDVFWERYLPAFEDWWADLGHPKLTPEVVAALVAGIEASAAGRSSDALAAERDRVILQILAARSGESERG
jgi:3-hydroxybutyryl-CoA dehydrogenase